MLKISDHRLEDWPYVKAADHGPVITPKLIVIHHTAGGKAESSVRWLTKEDQNYVSAHVLISRTGSFTQLVPFNTKAYHAGISSYKGRSNVNNFSIGIEIANYGYCGNDASPKTWTGAELPKDHCKIATHAYGQPVGWWQEYTDAQITAASLLCRSLIHAYPTIEDITGHDVISPGRKTDPGPLFPMAALRHDALAGVEPVERSKDFIPALENIYEDLAELLRSMKAE